MYYNFSQEYFENLPKFLSVNKKIQTLTLNYPTILKREGVCLK